MLTRRQVLRVAALSPIGSLFPKWALADARGTFPTRRPSAAERKFSSRAVEETIVKVKAKVTDPELAWMFENCYPNTLDTTVQMDKVNGKPDAFIIAGDIDAMWLRDSSCQMWSYLPLAHEDPELQQLFRALIGRQSRSILLDPYANAFLPDPKSSKPLEWAVGDMTDMQPGVAERKWEIDSLCYCIRLGHGYWKATRDKTPFDSEWKSAMQLVIKTFREQQRIHDQGPYHFQRRAENPTDTQALGGYGNPARPVGLIYSMFRPSDDACLYSLFVPANLFAMVSLRQLAEMATQVMADTSFASECSAFAAELESTLTAHGRLKDKNGSEFWAYEVDGYGNKLFMDDANIPNLSSLPYLGCCSANDSIYRTTRARAWSIANPYFIHGSGAEGIGSPHVDGRSIWPMSFITRAMTSSDDAEITQCLRFIKATHAGTGFIHESFDKDDPSRFTRPWFGWANSFFGELIIKLSEERPNLLKRVI